MPGGDDYRAGNFTSEAPGKRYRYSNVGASLAAFLVEVASGIRSTTGATDASSDRWG